MALTVLITGANRGIGQGLTKTYLAREAHTVIAAVRNPNHPTSQALLKLPTGNASVLILVKIDSADHEGPFTTVKELQHQHGITKLDLVIANAAISTLYPTALRANPQDILDHVEINAIGPLLLFQATQPLLAKSSNAKFVAIGSSAGSIGGMELVPWPNAVYGPTKAMLHYLLRKIHFEHDDITAFPVDPGWVQTEMGDGAAKLLDVPGGKAETPTDDSVQGVVKIIDSATKASLSGKFPKFNGQLTDW
ncbi:MAG: hypothetical protein Q9159_004840 [Coniocarpon cinnabarinum]